MELLAQAARATLSAALAELARHEQYLALEDDGRRYDIGARYGLLIAQLALALNGQDRAEVLAQILELLADREMRAAAGERASEPAHRHHHGGRSSDARPLAGRPLPRRCRSTNCSPSAQALDRFRRASDNLYERVRALFFLYAIHRFHLPLRAAAGSARADSRSPATPTC